MAGNVLLAPIPKLHIKSAFSVLADHEFVAFGSDAYEFFEHKAAVGTPVLIYASHDEADLVATYRGIYQGHTVDRKRMHRLVQGGYRPMTAEHETGWAVYWFVSDLEALAEPVPLNQLQLPGGQYLDSYPRGPLEILNAG